MELSIAAHNIEVKLVNIRKHIQYAIDDLPMTAAYRGRETLEKLLNRMDIGTDVTDSIVPNRISGDLSLVEELNCLNNITLTKGNNYV